MFGGPEEVSDLLKLGSLILNSDFGHCCLATRPETTDIFFSEKNRKRNVLSYKMIFKDSARTGPSVILESIVSHFFF